MPQILCAALSTLDLLPFVHARSGARRLRCAQKSVQDLKSHETFDQGRDVEAGETNGQQNGSAHAEEGIVTVVSAAEAAAARAGATAADKAGDTARAERLARHADRAARGEADHNVTGIMLYALSTVSLRPDPAPQSLRLCNAAAEGSSLWDASLPSCCNMNQLGLAVAASGARLALEIISPGRLLTHSPS